MECYHSTAVASAATHIALLDNDAIVLKGLQQIIEYNHLGSITWTTRSGREAVQRCSSAVDTPHLLLFDMSLDGMSGIDVCRQIRKRSASVLLLGITAFPPRTVHFSADSGWGTRTSCKRRRKTNR